SAGSPTCSYALRSAPARPCVLFPATADPPAASAHCCAGASRDDPRLLEDLAVERAALADGRRLVREERGAELLVRLRTPYLAKAAVPLQRAELRALGTHDHAARLHVRVVRDVRRGPRPIAPARARGSR